MHNVLRTMAGIIESLPAGDEAFESLVFSAWRSIAGGDLGAKTVPIRFDSGTLEIAVVDVTWQRNLSGMSGQMLRRLNSCFDGNPVRFIRLVVDTKAFGRRVDPRSANASHPVDDIVKVPGEIANAANGISDPGLRREFVLAAVGCLSRNRK